MKHLLPLGAGVSRFARGLLALAGVSAMSLAQGAAPPEWTTTNWGGGGACLGCHGSPVHISVDGRSFLTMIPIARGVWSNLGSTSAFTTYMQTALVQSKSGAMTSFAGTASAAQFEAVRAYLQDVRDARVVASTQASTPLAGGSNTTVALGTLTFGVSASPQSATITVSNPRQRALSYSFTKTSGGSAEITGSTTNCTSGTAGQVGGGDGTCTITLSFTPTSAGGAKSASFGLSFTDDGVDPQPPARQFTVTGFTNLQPVASAGGNQSGVPKNATVTLNGTGSTDGNGDALSYAWTVTAPGGGSVALAGAGATRTFTATQVGVYSASLTVFDGIVNSAASTATVTVTNTAPTAVGSATPATPAAPALVSLSSAGSSDPNGDTLTYAWVLTLRPAGSTAALSSTTTANPTFTADKSGTYNVTLQVNDGSALSNTVTLALTLNNTSPVANAGPAQTVTAPATVTLAGSGTDANSDTLSYGWAFTSRPALSAAALTNATSPNATFNADKSGSYVLALTASDGQGGSDTKSVTITANNTPPVANAGGARTASVGSALTLSGSGTDANGDTLTYNWTMTTRPATSVAALSGATTAVPSFTPDVVGSYTVQLTVNDGQGGSNSASAVITVLLAPVANAGPAQTVVTGSTVALDGRASTTSTAGALSYAWSLTSQPAGSTSALSSTTSATPTFAADVSGLFVATLRVTDSLGTSPAVSVTLTATRRPVASAGPAQTVIIGNVVTLDGTGSTDADGDPITYTWTLGARPAGSAASLAGATSSRPTLVPDVAGSYGVSLVVSDGKLASVAAGVTVTANNPPAVFTQSATSLAPSTQLTLSTTVSAVLGNGGGVPLTLGTPAFSGVAAGDYAFAASNSCTAGRVIPPGGSCTLVIGFAPTALGSRISSLSIPHDATGSPASITLNGTATPAPQGRIALSALSLTFPATQVATSTSQTLTLQNSGDALLAFSGFDLAGTAAADFTKGGSCSATAPLAIGANCTIGVSFQPTATGSRSATLTVRSDASNGTAVVTLGGTGTPVPAPAVSFSSATLDFGNQTVGGLYPARSVTLTNSGTAELASIAVTVAGTGFAATGPACPATLAAGAACTVSLTFTPGAAALDYTGTLRVSSNASGSPHAVVLAGRGTAAVVPSLAWSPVVARLDFGNVMAGSVSATQTAILVNNGPGGAILSLLNAVGPDGATFSVTAGTCVIGQVLFEGQNCSIDMRFAPGSAGTKTATVQVASSGNNPADLALMGTGLGGISPSLGLSAMALGFTAVRVGAQSLPTEITLKGTGSGVVTVTAMAVSGAYTLQSKSCPSLPFALPAGAECTVNVFFVPQAEGNAAGKLTLTTDGTPASQEVALTGTGEPAPDLSGGGGCSIARGDRTTDPTLWLLLIGAIAALVYRRRVRP